MHKPDPNARKKIDRLFNGDSIFPPDRMYALSILHITQSSIASSLGISKQAVQLCITDATTSANIASKIAQETGIPLKKLWPCGKYSEQSELHQSVKTNQSCQ